jgi:NADH-quinone oxidoreductase subunit G
MAKIIIDNQAYQVDDGQNLLQACLALKLDLPYFCWHPAMGSVGACRQCAMTQYQDENDQRGRLIVACMTPVAEGMRVSMQQPQEKEFREQVISALMTHHPHDCPVCAEGGECHLQDMTVMAGHHARDYKGKKTTFVNQQLGPLIKHEMNRCITCYRCERFYKDYAGGTDLTAQASRNNVYFGRQCDGTLESEFAGNLVEVCPTGVFTDKPFGDHYSRKWDLQSAPSVCQHCAVGCNTSLSERYGSVRRVTNRYNADINGYFLCDRGRFGFDFVNSEKRRRHISLNGQQSQWRDPKVSKILSAKGKWIGIGSAQASLEDNFALQQLVGAENFCVALDAKQAQLLQVNMAILKQWQMASLAEMEQADAIVILGEDINNSAPRIALAIRQALSNKAKAAAEALRVPAWQDAAVRALLPHHEVPLAVLGYGDSPLAKQATISLLCDDKQAAEQGFLLANLLSGNAPTPRVSVVDDATLQLVEVLKTAKRPLLVCGWSAANPALLSAAANIRKALQQLHKENDQTMLCIAPAEANSLSLGLLMQSGYMTAEQVHSDVAKGNCNVLVLDHHSAKAQSQLKLVKDKAASFVRLSELSVALDNELNLPLSSFSECSGSLLNFQGLIQSRYPATKPSEQCMPAWQWLVNIAKQQHHGLGDIADLGQLRDLLAKAHPSLAAHFSRQHKGKLAMQTPRVSGRTAMLANQTVHEPKPFAEDGADYKQSMEGLVAGHESTQPLAYSWSPGWNSNQSNHKFKAEYGHEGTKQAELAAPPSEKPYWFKWQTAWSSLSKGKWKILPRYRVFGSDGLSLQALPIASLSEPSSLYINSRQANELGLSDGQIVSCDKDATAFTLFISDAVPARTLLAYVRADQHFVLEECDSLQVLSSAELKKYQQAQLSRVQCLEVQGQTQHQHLLAQDAYIPISFIEGVT